MIAVVGAMKNKVVMPSIDAGVTPGLIVDDAELLQVVPGYWAEACKHLIKKDRVMKRLIPQFPGTSIQSRGDAFSTLARSIIGQQISVKAAQTV